MAITPNDILNKEFNNKFRGYDPEQVNDYLDIIRVELEKQIEENKNLSRDLAEAQDKISYFSQLQESLNSSIIIAQEAAERLKQNARKEAELILYEAEGEANRVIMEANSQSNEIFSEAQKLRHSIKHYRQEMLRLIEDQLQVVNNDSFDRLFEGTVLSPAQANNDRLQTEAKLNQLVEQEEQGFNMDNLSHSYQAKETTEDDTNLNSDSAATIDDQEDLAVTQVFDLNQLRELEATDVNPSYDDVTKKEAPMPLSREELEAYQRETNRMDDSDLVQQDLSGETIRIDLPTEDDYNK